MAGRISSWVIALLTAVMSFGVWAGGDQSLAKAQSAPGSAKPKAAQQNNAEERGERVFMDNCSRCHKPPMTIPPRITGTVVMHMRVKARLSRQDEQALLHYLAP